MRPSASASSRCPTQAVIRVNPLELLAQLNLIVVLPDPAKSPCPSFKLYERDVRAVLTVTKRRIPSRTRACICHTNDVEHSIPSALCGVIS
jgi:hypothetical protein